MSSVHRRHIDKYSRPTYETARFCTVIPDIDMSKYPGPTGWYLFTKQHGHTLYLHIDNSSFLLATTGIKLDQKTYNGYKKSFPLLDECRKKTPQKSCLDKYKGEFLRIPNPSNNQLELKFQLDNVIYGNIVLNCDKEEYVLLSEIPVKVGKNDQATIGQIVKGYTQTNWSM